jgi:hypothetical protein
MSPESNYAPCPECAADNVVYRSTCWRCGAALPYSLGLDGRMHHNPSSRAPREKQPVEKLLDTARNLAMDREGDKPHPERPVPDPPSGR